MSKWAASVAAKGKQGFQVLLNNRPLKTPGRRPLIISSPLLSSAVAGEWEAQHGKPVALSMPLTGLCASSIDRLATTPNIRDELIGKLSKSLENDLCCVRARPERLQALQAEMSDPLIDWFEVTTGARMQASDQLFRDSYGADIVGMIVDYLGSVDTWVLLGIESLRSCTNSLILSLALKEGRITPSDAIKIVNCEENYQRELYGFVEGVHDLGEADLTTRVVAGTLFMQWT